MSAPRDSSWVYLDRHLDDPEVQDLGDCGRAGVVTRRAPGKDGANEDAAAVAMLAGGAVALVVADGMGGGPCGDAAARIAVEQVLASLTEPGDAGLRERVLSGFDRGNRAILDLGVGAATTLAVVTVADGQLRPYHCGDTEVLVVGQRGKLKLQTVSHSPVGYAVEAGVLDESEALFHEDRHLISNLLGSDDMRIDVGPALELALRDRILVATDGIFDNLHLREIVDDVRVGSLAVALRRLAESATARMAESDADTPSKPDDATAILYRRPVGSVSPRS